MRSKHPGCTIKKNDFPNKPFLTYRHLLPSSASGNQHIIGVTLAVHFCRCSHFTCRLDRATPFIPPRDCVLPCGAPTFSRLFAMHWTCAVNPDVAWFGRGPRRRSCVRSYLWRVYCSLEISVQTCTVSPSLHGIPRIQAYAVFPSANYLNTGGLRGPSMLLLLLAADNKKSEKKNQKNLRHRVLYYSHPSEAIWSFFFSSQWDSRCCACHVCDIYRPQFFHFCTPCYESYDVCRLTVFPVEHVPLLSHIIPRCCLPLGTMCVVCLYYVTCFCCACLFLDVQLFKISVLFFLVLPWVSKVF